jgi:hypothetical protein
MAILANYSGYAGYDFWLRWLYMQPSYVFYVCWL